MKNKKDQEVFFNSSKDKCFVFIFSVNILTSKFYRPQKRK